MTEEEKDYLAKKAGLIVSEFEGKKAYMLLTFYCWPESFLKRNPLHEFRLWESFVEETGLELDLNEPSTIPAIVNALLKTRNLNVKTSEESKE